MRLVVAWLDNSGDLNYSSLYIISYIFFLLLFCLFIVLNEKYTLYNVVLGRKEKEGVVPL